MQISQQWIIRINTRTMSEETKVTDSTCSVAMEEEWKEGELEEEYVAGKRRKDNGREGYIRLEEVQGR